MFRSCLANKIVDNWMNKLKHVVVIIILVFATGTSAQERTPLSETSIGSITSESQAMAEFDGIDLVWWIPREYWESSFLQDQSMGPDIVDEMMAVLGNIAILGVVQADISRFGAFSFLDRDAVLDSMTVRLVVEGGNFTILAPMANIDPDVEILLAQFTPILASAMGNMGQNFHFFVFDDIDQDGERIVSPYEAGILQIVLEGRTPNSPTMLELEFPMDALFVPRLCPNGKPAHVTWNYCPWDGSEL